MGNPIDHIDEEISRMAEVAGSLGTILEKVEPHFLQLGRDLGAIHSDAERLTKLSAQSARAVGGGSKGGFLWDIEAVAGRSLKRLERSRTDVTAGLRHVETGMGHLETLQHMCPVIRDIAKTLNIIALNIAMESSRSREGEEMFSFFVREIKDLSGRVNEISHKIRDDSEKARASQRDIFRSVEKRETDLSRIAGEADRMVKDSLNRIELLLKMFAGALEEAGKRSREISGHIGEVVASIQFHDITRQQIGHVMEAIQDMVERCGEYADRDMDATDWEALGNARSVLSIQAAQIRQVIEEIGQAREKISTSFAEIGREIEILVKETSDLWLRNGGEGENPMERLVSSLTDLDGILEEGHGLAKKIEEGMMNSSEVASGLSVHIHEIEDISFDLHIKAINAIIMSGRMGRAGRAHAVLAQDVTEISKKSDEFASRVVEVIRSISELAHESGGFSPEGNEEGAGQATGIDMEQVLSAYRSFQEDASHTFEQSSALKERIHESEAGLSFMTEYMDRLTGCLDSLNRTIHSLDAFTGDGKGMERGYDHGTERYTMKIERDVHEKVFEKTEDTARSPEERVDGGENDFGDNVELF
jgi:methyl-accepting chemotaxis protein